MIDGYRRAVSADLGFDVRPLLAAGVEAPNGVPVSKIRDHLRSLPGVAGAAATTTPPMSRLGNRQTVAMDGSGTNAMFAEKAVVSSDFFNTVAIPVRRGRSFVSREDELRNFRPVPNGS